MKFHVFSCKFYNISMSQFDANKLYMNIGMCNILNHVLLRTHFNLFFFKSYRFDGFDGFDRFDIL